MSNEQQIEKVVRQLVQSHFEIEPSIDEIVWFRDGEEQEIRLIEINRDTLPTRSVEVFSFAPTQDVPFPVRIADITPQEKKGANWKHHPATWVDVTANTNISEVK